MAIASDSENLEIDSSRITDGLLVSGAVLLPIAGDCAIGDMNVARIDVYVGEEVFVHGMVKAFCVFRRQSNILVQVKCGDARKIEMFLAVQAHELTVYANHGSAGGQAECERRLLANRIRNEMRGAAANLFLIALKYHQHVRAFRSLPCKSSPQLPRVQHRQELPETADHQVVAVRAVEAQHINHGFSLSGINDLANAKQRFATRDAKE